VPPVTRILPGGPAIPQETLVQCDRVTVVGDGSRERPLGTGSGLGAIADGVTILGNGTAAHPLRAGDVPVTSDQVTILGSGTTEDPLRETPGPEGQEFSALFSGGNAAARVGMPVVVVGGPETNVVPSSSLTSSIPGTHEAANGVVSSIVDSGRVRVQTTGIVTLTTAQWDLVTGGSGGLVLGDTYYVSPSASGGLTTPRPATAGLLVDVVGVGISPTSMLLTISPVVQNLGDLTIDPNFGAIVGSAVFVASGDTVNPATSNASLANSRAVGAIAVSFSTGVTQIAGKVVLTPTQWAAITDTGGLVFGTAYYVDTSAHPGRLTAIEPDAGFAAQVGVALSTTTLLLSTPIFPLALP
jgi:hypothetical protein